MTDVDPADQTIDDLLDGLLDSAARDWPYDGPRNVTLAGVTVEAHERFFEVYDEDGKRLDFDERRQYESAEDVPDTHTVAPQVNLVLNMEVDDAALPEMDYPPLVKLGDTQTVEVDPTGTKFRFIKTSDGTPRKINPRSGYAAFLAAVAKIHPETFKPKLAAVIKDEERWNPVSELFDGVALVYDSTKVTIGGYSKDRAWPVGAPEAGVSGVEGSGDPTTHGAKTVEEIAAAATSAEDFRNSVIGANLGDSALVAEVVQDAAGAWEKYKTA